MTGQIGDVNPVAIASAFLEADDVLLGVYRETVPDAETVPILGVVRPPYPMFRVVATPGGSLNDLRWRISPEVMLEVWGDTDGTPGPAALQRLALTAVGRLKTMEDADWQPWQPVVTAVDASQPYPLDDPTGQARWLSTVAITCHPALAPELAPYPLLMQARAARR